MFGREVLLSDEAKVYINSYDWPGNIRQLRNAIERLVLVTKGNNVSPELVASMLGITIDTLKVTSESNYDDPSEKAKILRILSEAGYNQKEAAKRLGMDRSTLYRKLKALGIEVKKICNT
jgi:transcriptional regulator of acetoin/glycerol metabolism